MEEVQKHLFVLILAGGGGTRLWPLSREASPKQFLKLFEGKSLFQMTLDRARKLTSPHHIFISTSAKYVTHIKKEAAWVVDENIIAEPMRRDTAMAMGLGSLYIYKRDPQAVVINLPSDHLIRPEGVYHREILKAVQAAWSNNFVVVGVRPRFPHTGYGHIQTVGQANSQGVLAGKKFVEKPALELAKKFTKDPNYFWNVGQYVWPAKLFLELLQKHAPKIYAQFPHMAKAIGTEREKEILYRAFQMAPTISVDYAVSEKLSKFVCLPASFHWTDIGDWSEVRDNLPHDQVGNVILSSQNRGNYIGVSSTKNLLVLDKQLIATVGVENLLIVDTPDAILICNVNDDQAVKQLHQMLVKQGLTMYL